MTDQTDPDPQQQLAGLGRALKANAKQYEQEAAEAKWKLEAAKAEREAENYHWREYSRRRDARLVTERAEWIAAGNGVMAGFADMTGRFTATEYRALTSQDAAGAAIMQAFIRLLSCIADEKRWGVSGPPQVFTTPAERRASTEAAYVDLGKQLAAAMYDPPTAHKIAAAMRQGLHTTPSVLIWA